MKTEIEILRELRSKFIKGKFTYDKNGQYIWNVHPSGHLQKIADLRGWGAIQNLFIDKRDRVDVKKAAELQDFFGEWIAKSLNFALEQQLDECRKEKHEFASQTREMPSDEEIDEKFPLKMTVNEFDRGYETGVRHGIKWLKSKLQ